jgi:hypothetical protein
MALTSQQSAALKADILADPLLAAQPMNSDGAFAIAQAYNLLASPAFRVWRTDIPTKDIKTAIVWTEYIGRSLNGADVNVRQGIQDCFSGPSGVNTRTQLTTIAKRDATRAEKLFAAGTGSEAVPATMGFEGALSFQDVEAARSLP